MDFDQISENIRQGIAFANNLLGEKGEGLHILARVDKDIYSIRSALTGKTLMHCAVESCNSYIVQDILQARPDALFDKDNEAKSPQHYAAALEECFLLELLLSQGADILEPDKNKWTALHIAADSGSISNVKLLVLDDENLLLAEDNLSQTALHIACMKGHRKIVSFLLESGADPLLRQNDGMNCLEVAVEYKQDGVVEMLLLSDHWRELISNWKGGVKKCFAHLVSKMPDEAKILLDRCVMKSNDKPQSADYHVTYDFFLLEPSGSKQPKFDSLTAILQNNEEQCLTHKLCQKYFTVKWREKGCYLYLGNLFIYLLFHILFNVHMLLVRGAIARRRKDRVAHACEATNTTASPQDGHSEPTAGPDDAGQIITAAVIATVAMFNILKEFVQLFTQGWRYFTQISNYLEWALYICVLLSMFPVERYITENQFVAGAIAVCISWCNLIWFLRRIPDIGTYILTLQKVFKTLVKMLVLIVLFCMAFASTFYLIFAERSRFENYPIAVLSTFVSMLGDFSYDDLFVEVRCDREYYAFKIGVFVVFVLLMVIVVNNVLIGLAVGDTEHVMKMAKVQRLKQQIKFIMEVESSAFSRFPCFKKSKTTTYTEYPNQKRSLADNFNRLLAGELNLSYNEDESRDEDSSSIMTREKIEEIVQARLEDYHKEMMQELKDFHSDIVKKFGELNT